MIVTPNEMRAIEETVFAKGTTAEALMDAVGKRIAQRIGQCIGRESASVVFYAGKGNNAGDALVAASELSELAVNCGLNVRIKLRFAFEDRAALGPLPARKLASISPEAVQKCTAQEIRDLVIFAEKFILVDGLLGIGAKDTLRGPVKSAAAEINSLRLATGAYVIAIDVPTGVDAETGVADQDAVVADETLAVGFAKIGLLTDEAVNHVGKLEVISLPDFADAESTVPAAASRAEVVVADNLAHLLPPRPHESNKGMYGRVGILAGSVGATGAAVMCSHACAKAGAGLITLLPQPDIYPIVAGAAAPEIMVKPLANLLDVLDMDFDVLGIGPGLGSERGDTVCELVARWPKPMVVDADGLNALAKRMDTLRAPAGTRLLTPHPGEMKRLLRGISRLKHLAEDHPTTRAEIARRFTDEFPVTLLLKGARTVVAERERPLAYNSTGNAGMATGGMGDILTGICCALAGQQLALYDAARLGAWIHGRAADLARAAGESEQSLLPMNLLMFLGRAFMSVRCVPR